MNDAEDVSDGNAYHSVDCRFAPLSMPALICQTINPCCCAHLGCAGLEEPVKAEAPVIPNGSLQLIPGSVAQLVNLAQNESVLLLCVGLALVGAILQLQLLQSNTILSRCVTVNCAPGLQ